MVNDINGAFPDLIRILDFAPKVASFPLILVPASLRQVGFIGCLNQAFNEQLEDGELDFIEGKALKILIDDVAMSFSLTLDQSKFVVAEQEPDCVFSGCLADFILLSARREDPDTLFFQRRLMIEWDTEIGLAVKNFLCSVEPEEQFPLLFRFVERFADIVEVVASARQSFTTPT